MNLVKCHKTGTDIGHMKLYKQKPM